MAKKSIIKTSAHRRLEQLGTKLINQANNNKALEDLGKSSNVESLRDAMNNIFDEISPSEHNAHQINGVLSKGKELLALIRSNHYSVKDSTNFDIEAIEQDLSDTQDIIFRIDSLKMVNVDQLKQLNLIHRTHSNLQKLIKPIGNSNK
tara:strand:+ start:286 stop:729 length:444 start_codon:yes stop_codon:yes gene_type:complete